MFAPIKARRGKRSRKVDKRRGLVITMQLGRFFDAKSDECYDLIINNVQVLVDEKKYPMSQLAMLFGTSNDMIYRVYSRYALMIPNLLAKKIWELDFDELPSPMNPRLAFERYKRLARSGASPIVVMRKELPPLDLCGSNPNYHVRYWFEMGFSTRDIAQIIGITAGDVNRALNETSVSIYAARQILDRTQEFRKYLIN